jgi:very-short-patch-repair endonuclease
MSRIRKISHNKPEVKEKMRQKNIENNAKAEVKAKHQKVFRKYWGKEESRKQQSQKKITYFSSEENRKNHSELLKDYYATHKEYKKEITERLSKWRELATDEELEKTNIKRIKTMNSKDARDRASENFKKYYSDINHKKEYLERIVKQQRRNKNKYEIMFMNILEEHNIDYIWQKPIITESGKGFVIDFYLPQYDLYVNIDGSIHGFNGEISNALVDFHSASDVMLDEYCKSKGLNIHHVDTRDLKGLDFNIKEVINL